jgi:glycosyltransferase involved in cell wall biosynthesis
VRASYSGALPFTAYAAGGIQSGSAGLCDLHQRRWFQAGDIPSRASDPSMAEEPSEFMKVVHICNVPLPPKHPDHGRISFHPGRWVLNLALAQRAYAGIDARLVMHVPGASADFRTEIEGVPAHFVAAPDRLRSATFFLPDILRLRKAVLAENPDVVHAHGTEDAYALAAQACGKPSVITAQGCFFIINRELPPRLVSRERVVQFTEWIALRRAKHVIAKSAYVRNELARAFPHLTIHEIPNTIDPRLLEIPVDRERKACSLAFVGTVVPRKGVHLIIDALVILQSENPDVFARTTLSVFGDRPGHESEYEGMSKKRLRDLLGEKVTFHGTIPAIEVAEALSRTAVLLAPSLEEMFGNQFIEAVAVGADAIVSEGTAMAENARRLQAGRIVAREDAPALAAAIRETLAHASTQSERERRRRDVTGFVGSAAVALAHHKLYEELLGPA